MKFKANIGEKLVKPKTPKKQTEKVTTNIRDVVKFRLPNLQEGSKYRNLLKSRTTFKKNKNLVMAHNVITIEEQIEKYNLQDRFANNDIPSFHIEEHSFSISYRRAFIVVSLYDSFRTIKIYDENLNLLNEG